MECEGGSPGEWLCGWGWGGQRKQKIYFIDNYLLGWTEKNRGVTLNRVEFNLCRTSRGGGGEGEGSQTGNGSKLDFLGDTLKRQLDAKTSAAFGWDNPQTARKKDTGRNCSQSSSQNCSRGVELQPVAAKLTACIKARSTAESRNRLYVDRCEN